jgi:hypothetical protein
MTPKCGKGTGLNGRRTEQMTKICEEISNSQEYVTRGNANEKRRIEVTATIPTEEKKSTKVSFIEGTEKQKHYEKG